jgi:DNA-binding beta-propeller fold protein YncE
MRLTILFLSGALLYAAGPATNYKITREIAIGGEGSFDYLTVDSDNNRLFVSHATQVEVVDIESGKVTGKIQNTPGVHGIAIAREFNRAFISNGNDDSVTMFDLKTLETIGKVKTGGKPDAILYDKFSKRVFVMNAKDSTATAIDAEKGTVAGTIPLGGKPEFSVADGNGSAYVNLEDNNAVAHYNTKTLKVVHTWPITGCEAAVSMALNKKNNRLFIGCKNAKMFVLDSQSGRMVASAPIGSGVDAAGFDAESGLIFMSAGDGTLTIVHQDTSDKYSVAQTVQTPKGAKTMAFNGKTKRVYLPVANFGPASAPTADVPKPKAPVVPGTFRVVEVSR